jgi:transposase-like protein
LTVIEDAQAVSAAKDQAPAAGGIKTRGSRRPRLSLDDQREIARLYANTSTSTSEICAQLGIGASTLYRIVQLQGLPPRGRTTSSTSPGITQPAHAEYPNRNLSPNAGRRRVLKTNSGAATSNGVSNGQAIESKVNRTPTLGAQPAVASVAGGAKSGTGRRRIAPIARRPKVAAPIETPATNSASVPAGAGQSRVPGRGRSREPVKFVVSYLAEQTLQAASALEAWQQARARGAIEVTSIVRIA